MSPDRHPHSSRPSRGFGVAALLVLLAWAQLIWPFLHAHEGPAQTLGWHLHTGAPMLAGMPQNPSASEALEREFRHSPHGPESAEIGPGTGLPGGRGLPLCADADLAPARLAPAAPRHGATPCITLRRELTSLRPSPRHAPGRPAQPHAPPAQPA